MRGIDDLALSVSEFVSLVNQTLDFAYPRVKIVGEISNFRVSRNRWVYFDLKDDQSAVKFFGTVYQLPGPLEDGLIVQVKGSPRLHSQYGFSINILNIQPVGEGSIKKAKTLLEAKLTKEGLFDPARKRLLPYPPECIGLITSAESAAYADFIKILGERWGGVKIIHRDIQVQGEQSAADIVSAIEAFNQHFETPDVLVITRGGGSVEDHASFNAEQVVRAISASRIPTLVAIGHEIDLSLAELAADVRASTPSNAAEVLVPDKKHVLSLLSDQQISLIEILKRQLKDASQYLSDSSKSLNQMLDRAYFIAQQSFTRQLDLLEALNPQTALKRGYAIIKSGSRVVNSVKRLKAGDKITIIMQDGKARGTITT